MAKGKKQPKKPTPKRTSNIDVSWGRGILEAEKRYKALMQNISDAVFIVSATTGKIIEVNEKAAELIGVPLKELIGMHQSKLHPADRDYKKIFLSHVKKGRGQDGEILVYNRKKGNIPVEINSKVFKSGGERLVIATFKDISEIKQRENVLKESEEKFRTLFMNMNSAFALHKVITDNKGKPIDYEYIEVNKAFEKFTGLKRKNVIGKRVRELIPGIEKDEADWIGNYGRVGLTGGTWETEQGSESLGRWYTVKSYSPKKGYFVAIFDEATRKKSSELKIKEQNKFSELRANMWSKAAERNCGIDEIIQSAIEGLGKILDVSRVVFSSYNDKYILSEKEWKADGVKGSTLGIKTPASTSKYAKKQIVLTEEKALKMVSGKARGPFISVIKLLAKITGRHPSLVTPIYVKGKLYGFISCIAIGVDQKYWTVEKQRLAYETVQIISKSIENKVAERSIKQQSRFNELRTEIWKYATERHASEKEIFDKVFSIAGPVLDVYRINYSHVMERYSITRNEWKTKDAKGSALGFKTPLKLFNSFEFDEEKVITAENVLNMVSPAFRPMFRTVVRSIVRAFGDNPGLVLPFKVNGKTEGVVTCVGGNESVEFWSKEKKSVLKDILNITSIMIEQRRAEKYIYESEEKYRKVFSTINDAVFIISINQKNSMPGKFVEVNDEACRSLGYTREELLEMSVRDIISNDRFSSLPSIMKSILGKRDITIESSHLHKTGTLFRVELKLKLIDFNGRKAVLGIARDIDSRKASESALTESSMINRTRAEIWKLANEKDKTEQEIIKGSLEILGPTIGADRIVFGAADENNFVIKDEWKIRGLKGLKGFKVPKELFYLMDVEEQNVIGMKEAKDSIDRHSAGKKSLANKLLKGVISIAGNKPALITPVSIEGKKDGIFSCTSTGGYEHWTAPRRQLVMEISNILSGIIEAKRAEKALADSEKIFRSLTESTSVGIAIIQNEKYVYMNPAGLKILGRREEEVTGSDMVSYFTDSSRQLVYERYRKRQNGENVPDRYEVHIRKNDGELRLLDLSAAIIEYYGSKATLATFIDVTERRSAEEKYKSIVDNMQDGLMVMENEKVFFVNKRLTDISGYTEKDFINGKVDFISMIASEEKDRVMQEYALMGKKGWKVSVTEFWARRKDGAKLFFRVRISTSVSSEGSKVQYIFITDITESKLAEIALKESEEKFRTLSEQSLIAIGVIQKGRYKYVNKGFTEIFGYTSDEACSFNADRMIEQFHPDYRDYIGDEIKSHLDAEAGVNGDYQVKMICKNGDEKWIDIYVKKVFYEGVKSDFLMFVDITKEKDSEEKLKDIIEELGRSNAELEKFAYVASHDLQEPLRMVTNYVQLLERRYGEKLDNDAKEFIGYAVEGSARMRDLIKDLLAYSRIRSSKNEKVQVDMNDTMKAVLYNLDNVIKSTNARIDIAEMPVIRGDKTQISQLMQNLLANALKFVDKGKTPNVRITAKKRDDEWVISVKDNGIGISPEYQDKIFVIFQRLHTREMYEGTGIGLALCKKIVENHGGEISVKSKEGKGAEFIFTLPDGSGVGEE